MNITTSLTGPHVNGDICYGALDSEHPLLIPIIIFVGSILITTVLRSMDRESQHVMKVWEKIFDLETDKVYYKEETKIVNVNLENAHARAKNVLITLDLPRAWNNRRDDLELAARKLKEGINKEKIKKSLQASQASQASQGTLEYNKSLDVFRSLKSDTSSYSSWIDRNVDEIEDEIKHAHRVIRKHARLSTGWNEIYVPTISETWQRNPNKAIMFAALSAIGIYSSICYTQAQVVVLIWVAVAIAGIVVWFQWWTPIHKAASVGLVVSMITYSAIMTAEWTSKTHHLEGVWQVLISVVSVTGFLFILKGIADEREDEEGNHLHSRIGFVIPQGWFSFIEYANLAVFAIIGLVVITTTS
jgi:hypothetical protein